MPVSHEAVRHGHLSEFERPFTIIEAFECQSRTLGKGNEALRLGMVSNWLAKGARESDQCLGSLGGLSVGTVVCKLRSRMRLRAALARA